MCGLLRLLPAFLFLNSVSCLFPFPLFQTNIYSPYLMGSMLLSTLFFPWTFKSLVFLSINLLIFHISSRYVTSNQAPIMYCCFCGDDKSSSKWCWTSTYHTYWLCFILKMFLISQITFYTSEIFQTANLQESIIPYVSLGVAISELISIIFCVSQTFLGLGIQYINLVPLRFVFSQVERTQELKYI